MKNPRSRECKPLFQVSHPASGRSRIKIWAIELHSPWSVPLCYAAFTDIKLNFITVEKEMECKNKVNKVLNTTFKTAKAAASFPTAFGQLLLFYYEKE